jgi:hypothetical protein
MNDASIEHLADIVEQVHGLATFVLVFDLADGYQLEARPVREGRVLGTETGNPPVSPSRSGSGGAEVKGLRATKILWRMAASVAA